MYSNNKIVSIIIISSSSMSLSAYLLVYIRTCVCVCVCVCLVLCVGVGVGVCMHVWSRNSIVHRNTPRGMARLTQTCIELSGGRGAAEEEGEEDEGDHQA